MKTLVKAPAKVNLCLKVNFKREDGYHDLSMIMQTISLFDKLYFEIIKNNSVKDSRINLCCNFSYIPTDSRNLIYKITEYIFNKFKIDDEINISIDKMIPVGGGLGGGSSDAASTLLFLNKFYKLNLSIEEMTEIAMMFGSDIPFFLHKHECICEGRGEKIEKLIPFNNYYILIMTPSLKISTKEVYSKLDIKNIADNQLLFENCKVAIKTKNFDMLARNIFNDLESVTTNMCNEIQVYKSEMMSLGAKNALMSGSGSTVFGLFNSYFKALNCKNILKKKYKSAFIFLSKPI